MWNTGFWYHLLHIKVIISSEKRKKKEGEEGEEKIMLSFWLPVLLGCWSECVIWKFFKVNLSIQWVGAQHTTHSSSPYFPLLASQSPGPPPNLSWLPTHVLLSPCHSLNRGHFHPLSDDCNGFQTVSPPVLPLPFSFIVNPEQAFQNVNLIMSPTFFPP